MTPNVHRFVAPFATPGASGAARRALRPVVEVPEDAPLLDRVIGLTGRVPRGHLRLDNTGIM
jgi:hypothetical protein